MNKVHESAHEGRHDSLAHNRAKQAGERVVRAEHYSDGSERRPPKASHFRLMKFNPRVFAEALSISAWRRGDIAFFSALELADAPDGSGEPIPQWHVSVSCRPDPDRTGTVMARRPTDREAHQVLATLGMVGAEEDNHHPGVARHFWMPVDPKRRVDCECKTTEKVITEPDGYRWSTPNDDNECHGCEYEAAIAKLGQSAPCPVHKLAKP